MTRAQVSETAIAAVVITWLEELGADVYQEVELPTGGGIADIVARVGAELWIVETKTSLSLALVMQAVERRRSAHRVIIAAPHTRNQRDVAWLCRELGLGMVEVQLSTTYDTPHVREIETSRRWNRRPVELGARLRPEHKTAKAAGSTGGGRWTPFRDTCDQLRHAVERKPGIALKEAIAAIRHHYRSMAGARSSLAHWIKAGKVPGVRVERGHLYPTQGSNRT